MIKKGPYHKGRGLFHCDIDAQCEFLLHLFLKIFSRVNFCNVLKIMML